MDQKFIFSIIVPTYNRPEQLATCLRALARLDYPRECFEVIIVDDGSRMHLDPLINRFREQLTVQLIRQDNAGPAAARNTGSVHAQGQFFVFTDDDCRPDSQWLQILAQGFTEFPEAVLGGCTLNELPDNNFSEASQLLLSYVYSYYNSDPEQAHFFASNNFAIAGDLFHALGGFDTTFSLAAAEDREFCDRCLIQGYRLVYLPEAQVYHAHFLNYRSFWRQHFNYGRGAFHFHQIRNKRDLKRIQVEPLSFYLRLLAYPLRHCSIAGGLMFSSLFFISQVANVAGFFWEWGWQNKLMPREPCQNERRRS